MEEDKSITIGERLKMRALAKQADDALKPLGLDAHTPRPWEQGDRVTVSELKTGNANQRKHAGESGIITDVEYMGAFDPAKYEPGAFGMQRWNPEQADPHADDFTIPIDPKKLQHRMEWDRLHDWRITVRLDSGETVRMWPYNVAGELKVGDVGAGDAAEAGRPQLTDHTDQARPAAPGPGASGPDLGDTRRAR